MTFDTTVHVDTYLTARELRAALEEDVRTGLTGPQKVIPPVWFYDEEGSRLFDAITRLPEYYPTRAERGLLMAHAEAIASHALAGSLVELGAGSCDKTRILLDAMETCGPLERYLPIDVSDQFLRASARDIAGSYRGLEVHAVIGDFHRHLDRIPSGGRRIFAFLGGTIGNLDTAARSRFFFDLNCTMSPGDHFLLGTDLVKDRQRIVEAYDDSAGVTAAFNRNVLSVLNRELGAHFDINRFEHVARWNEAEHWIEMRLRSSIPQVVTVDDLGVDINFDSGEEILTEISMKFTPSGIAGELEAADFVIDHMWGAEEGEYLLTLAHPFC